MLTISRKSNLRAAAILALALAATGFAGTAAQADSTWISGPSLSTVSLTGPSTAKTANGWSVSTQSTEFTIAYKGSVADAGKFAQINAFDFSTGLNLVFDSTPLASPTGCGQQVLAGDAHSCEFKLDGSGAAAIHVAVTGSTVASSFHYILLSGPNIAVTDPGTVTFTTPKSAVKPVLASVKAMAGGAALLRFKLLDGNKPSAGVKVTIALKGVGDNLSAATATSDSAGLVWVYVADLKAKKGTSTVTVTVLGTQTKGSATIKWVAGKLLG